MIHLEVAVAVPLLQTLTYCLGGGGEQNGVGQHENIVGRRVLVALGKRQVTGYVLSFSDGDGVDLEFQVKPILRFLDDFPIFQEDLATFFRWAADYYQFPIGLVIKAALPGGLAPKSQQLLRLTCHPRDLLGVCEDLRWNWLKELYEKGRFLLPAGSTALLSRKEKLFLKQLQEKELVSCEITIKKDLVTAKTETCYELSDENLPTCGEDNDYEEKLNLYREQLVEYLCRSVKISETKALYATVQVLQAKRDNRASLKDIRKIYSAAAKPLEQLEKDGIVRKTSQRVFRSPFGEQLRFYPRPDVLTPDQERVLAEVLPAINKKDFAPFLLHGVTGCGKTEVYMRAAESALECGRDVIILVPEIALATQLEAHLVSRFKDLVVLLHSGLTSSEKYDQYFLALSGKARIVIGARSAVFAPLKNPGVIIVDEEHDSSYKQDDSFRYHGRDLAVLRARHHKSVVILGSATPSITSYENAKSGKYRLLSMPKRVGDSTLPEVTLVDLNCKENGGSEKPSIIRKALLSKLKHTLDKKKQAVLLLNRRGFSTALLCRDCGNPVQCNHCNVSLTLHKSKNRLICHYCGFTASAQSVCVHCRSTDLVPAGFGTERVEEELHELLPEARICRLDSDTAADRKKFMVVLSEMHSRKIDILIGTQMIAKGHHFPHVTLVGVVWADGGMSMPDYKAAERTYQLITQVTGRAGRGEFPGEVIIQTLRPDHYAIQYARQHKYLEFFEHEMRLRRSPAFPPYVRLILFRVQGKVEKQVQQSAALLARYCRKHAQHFNKAIEVLGPAPSPLDKVRDLYRWQILLKGASSKELHVISASIKDVEKDLMLPQCTLSVDVDPENMM